jgi:hydrogenase maturation protein HypF
VAEVDLRPALRSAIEHHFSGVLPGAISGRFHNTLAKATATLIERAFQRAGRLPVVLTGGCFQNALLAERTLEQIERIAGVRVLLHRRVPPGDGGLALGQAVVAGALTASGGL